LREARQVVDAHTSGRASTEDLRKALIHYRALFDELIGGKHEEFKRVS
jgi:hypothetical protein